MNISKSMKIAMAHKELNQKQLSKESGISQVTISKIAQNNGNPSLEIINKLAQTMEYTLGDFIKLGEE